RWKRDSELLLHLKLPFNHVVILLCRSAIGRSFGSAGFRRSTGSSRSPLFIEHLTERVRSRLELLDGGFDRGRIASFGYLASLFDRLGEGLLIRVGQLVGVFLHRLFDLPAEVLGLVAG